MTKHMYDVYINLDPNVPRSQAITKVYHRRDPITGRYKQLPVTYQVTYPDGTEQLIKDVKGFCNRRRLDYQQMKRVIAGEISDYQGYKCSKRPQDDRLPAAVNPAQDRHR